MSFYADLVDVHVVLGGAELVEVLAAHLARHLDVLLVQLLRLDAIPLGVELALQQLVLLQLLFQINDSVLQVENLS